MSSERIELRPIGHVVGGRAVPEDDAWGASRCEIRLDDWVPDGVLDGLEEFSHVEVITVFHLVDPDAPVAARRRPRGIESLEPIGAMAQRHKDRFNRLGLSRASVLEVGARHLVVEGLDAIDGTPVLDVKPWFEDFGPRGPRREPPWVSVITEHYF